MKKGQDQIIEKKLRIKGKESKGYFLAIVNSTNYEDKLKRAILGNDYDLVKQILIDSKNTDIVNKKINYSFVDKENRINKKPTKKYLETTFLHLALMNIRDSRDEDSISILKELVDNNADINAKDNQGLTPRDFFKTFSEELEESICCEVMPQLLSFSEFINTNNIDYDYLLDNPDFAYLNYI